MKDLLRGLGIIAFIVIIVRLLFHRKYWLITWSTIILLTIFSNYMKEKVEERMEREYDHTPGYVYFQRNSNMNNWK